MLWKENKVLAIALRDQGLADCLAARFALRSVELTLLGHSVSFAHLVVSKAQQSVEKLTKGYLLWHSQSFDPTKGHAPFTELIDEKLSNQQRELDLFVQRLNVVNKSIVQELKWLESLAPKPPQIASDKRGILQSLEIIQENTEYPYWSIADGALIAPARGIRLWSHGVRAFKTLRNYLTALSKSDPPEYCTQIKDFLCDHPMSTEVSEWPL